MAEIKNHFQTISRRKTTVLALSVDSPKQSRALTEEMGLPFGLLCDEDRRVVDLYHLLNPHEHGGIAYPAIFVIKPTGVIGYRSLDRTAQRVNLSEILEYLRELADNPDHLKTATSEKSVIVPSVSTLLQIGKNMVRRGNSSDWKHYLFYPLFVARYLLGIARRRDDQKS